MVCFQAASRFHSQYPVTQVAGLGGQLCTDRRTLQWLSRLLSLERQSMLKASAWREWWLRPGQPMPPAVPVLEIVDAPGAYNIVDQVAKRVS